LVQNANRTEETDLEIEDDFEAKRAAAIAALERDGVPAAPIHVVMALIDRLAAGDES
jgi:hypothetical protein